MRKINESTLVEARCTIERKIERENREKEAKSRELKAEIVGGEEANMRCM